jgi:hypothetical protein
MKLLTMLTLLACATFSASASAAPRFERQDWAREPANGLPIVPWLAGTATLPDTQQPLFTLTSTASTTRADGWAAARAGGFFLRVRVTDPAHRQDRNAAHLYEGDSLQFAVDALGNGAPTGSAVAVRLPPSRRPRPQRHRHGVLTRPAGRPTRLAGL